MKNIVLIFCIIVSQRRYLFSVVESVFGATCKNSNTTTCIATTYTSATCDSVTKICNCLGTAVAIPTGCGRKAFLLLAKYILLFLVCIFNIYKPCWLRLDLGNMKSTLRTMNLFKWVCSQWWRWGLSHNISCWHLSISPARHAFWQR